MKRHIINNNRLYIEEGIDLMIVTQRNNYGICFLQMLIELLLEEKLKCTDIPLLTTQSMWSYLSILMVVL